MNSCKKYYLYFDYIIPLFRGIFYQIISLNFSGLLLLKRGSRIHGIRKLKWRGYLKVGEYSILDFRNIERITFGENCTIGDFTKITNSHLVKYKPEVRIGNNVSIGSYNTVQCGYGLMIGDDTFTAGYVGIYPENHIFDKDNCFWIKQEVNGFGIEIEKNVFICHGAVITDGVHIKSKSLIKPNTVVRKNDII